MSDSSPIIDSHIHLFPASELRTLSWHNPAHPLSAQHSLTEYRAATHPLTQRLRGFVFVETDRVSGLGDTDWEHALAEVGWLRRICEGTPRDGEGHEPKDARLCLGIVPWAPVPAGAEALGRYLERVEGVAGEGVVGRVKGFRYLVQDKPRGTMVGRGFVEGVRWLGERGYSFDLGVDFRSGGVWQLDEAVEMVSRVNEGVPGEKQVRIVINHMCKPDMQTCPEQTQPITSPTNAAVSSFNDWKSRMSQLAAFPNTFMKLSGGFSEMPALPSSQEQEGLGFWDRQALLERTAQHTNIWASEVLRLWGPQRCMFGSDWPVSNIGGGGNGVAWANWRFVVGSVIAHLSRQERQMVWSGTAERVYRIEYDA